MRIGSGYDSHRFVDGRPLILGGVTIPGARGLLGHSDADVLLHAVIDAVLGAIGECDIGTLFPDNDPAFKDISSMILLARVIERMRARGFSLVNVDTTIICEAPKLKDHIMAMRTNIANAFSVDADSVTIKAKTNEKMDDIGAGVGIAVHAVCLLSSGN